MRPVYFDASIILRWLLQQPACLDVERIEGRGVSSFLLRIECWRTLDREEIRARVQAGDRTRYAMILDLVFNRIQEIDLSRTILLRAAGHMPAPLGTLDAIHLSTALVWRETRAQEIDFATHDRELARAARLHGFQVLGV